MASEKIDEAIKKHNKKIVGRMKEVVGVGKNTELPAKSGISGSDISHFISSNNRAFYKIIVDFCVQHSVNIVWLITGAGDKFIQTAKDTPNTPEERELVSKFLAIMRHAPEDEMRTVFRNLVNHHYEQYAKYVWHAADMPGQDKGAAPDVK